MLTAMLYNDLPHFTTKAEIARALNVDPRSKLISKITPVAIFVTAGKKIELYEAHIPAALSLNATPKTNL